MVRKAISAIGQQNGNPIKRTKILQRPCSLILGWVNSKDVCTWSTALVHPEVLQRTQAGRVDTADRSSSQARALLQRSAYVACHATLSCQDQDIPLPRGDFETSQSTCQINPHMVQMRIQQPHGIYSSHLTVCGIHLALIPMLPHECYILPDTRHFHQKKVSSETVLPCT